MTYAAHHKAAKQREANRRYRSKPANQQKLKEKYQRWYRAGGKEVRLAYAQDKHKGIRASERDRARALRVSTLMLLGGRCERCGNNDMRVLQVDHVNGDGSTDRLKKPAVRLAEVFAEPERYQCLCANCNWIKRAEHGEYNKATVI